MKKLIIALFILCPGLSIAQKFIDVPVDSVLHILTTVEHITGTKLKGGERGDSLQSYFYKDSSWYIRVRFDVKRQDQKVEYIVISGPETEMNKIFKYFVQNSANITNIYKQTITTKDWEADMRDVEIDGKNGRTIWGFQLWFGKL